MQRRASNDIGASRGARERVRESNCACRSDSSAFTLIALICSVLPFVERGISHGGLETTHDALADGLDDLRGRSGLFYRMDANRVGRSMCDAT
jgi:hypothetical protein